MITKKIGSIIITMIVLNLLLYATSYATINLPYPAGEHPRIFIKKGATQGNRVGLDDIIARIKNDPNFANFYSEMKKYVDQYPNYPQNLGINMALIYLIEKEMGNQAEADKYLGYVKPYLQTAIDGQDLLWDHNGVRVPNYGEHVYKAGLLYDWLYDGLTQPERDNYYNQILDQIKEATLKSLPTQTLATDYFYMMVAPWGEVLIMEAAIAVWNEGSQDQTIQYLLDDMEKYHLQTMIPLADIASGLWHNVETYDLGGSGGGSQGIAVVTHLWDEITGSNTWEMLPQLSPQYTTNRYYLMAKKANGITIHVGDQHEPKGWMYNQFYPSLFEFHNKNKVGQQIELMLIQENGYSVQHYDWHRLIWLDDLSPVDISKFSTAVLFEDRNRADKISPGVVILRDKWQLDGSDTKIFFKSGNWFTAKNHFSVNHFGIYKHGDLAIEDGADQNIGGEINRLIYDQSTVSSNSITVSDPAIMLDEGQEYIANGADGGRTDNNVANKIGEFPVAHGANSKRANQVKDSWWDTGNILHFETTSTYDYAVGDGANAYRFGGGNNPGDVLDQLRLDIFQRELAYLNKKYLVVFDRVRATSPEFVKRWYLHTVLEPQMTGTKTSDVSTTVDKNGNKVECQTAGCSGATEWDGRSMSVLSSKSGWTESGDGGKLFLKMLLPDNGIFRKRGGGKPGITDPTNPDFFAYANWRHDRNFPYNGNLKLTDYPTYEGRGRWRIEEETSGRLYDMFLNVLYPTVAATTAMPEVLRVDAAGGNMVGAHIRDSGENMIAMFSTDQQGAAVQSTSYSIVPTTTFHKHFLFNMKANTRYTVSYNGTTSPKTVTVVENNGGTKISSAEGVLYFTITNDQVDTTAPGSPTLCIPGSTEFPCP